MRPLRQGCRTIPICHRRRDSVRDNRPNEWTIRPTRGVIEVVGAGVNQLNKIVPGPIGGSSDSSQCRRISRNP